MRYLWRSISQPCGQTCLRTGKGGTRYGLFPFGVWGFCLLLGWAGGMAHRLQAQPVSSERMTGAFLETGIPWVRHFDSKAFGTGYSTVWDVYQDSAGVMYFANNAGVLMYEGSQWTLLPTPAPVRCVHRAADGRIYAGCVGDFGVFLRQPSGALRWQSLEEQFRNHVPEASRKFTWIEQIFALPDQLLFYSDEAIFGVPLKSEAAADFRVWPAPKSSAPSASEDGMGARSFVGAGWMEDRLWLFQATGTRPEDLRAWQFQDRTFRPQPGGAAPLPAAFSRTRQRTGGRTLLLDVGGRPWIRTKSGGWHLLFPEAPARTCQAAAALADGRWVLALDTGLCLTGPEGNRLKVIPYTALEMSQYPVIRALTVDRTGGLWMGHSQGVSRVLLHLPVRSWNYWTEDQGRIEALALGSEGMYLGTNRGLWYLDAGGRFRVSGPSDEIAELLPIQGGVLVGGAGGLNWVRGLDAERLLFPQASPYVRVHALCRSLQDSLRVCVAHEQGVSAFRWMQDGWEPDTLQGGEAVRGVACVSVLETADGVHWVVTQAGAVWKDGEAIEVPDQVRRLQVFGWGNTVLFYTDQGYFRWQPDPEAAGGGSLVPMTRLNDLQEQQFYTPITVSGDYIYIHRTGGLALVRRKAGPGGQLQVERQPVSLAYLSPEKVTAACWAEGRHWLAYHDQLVSMEARPLPKTVRTFRPLLRQVGVGEDSVWIAQFFAAPSGYGLAQAADTLPELPYRLNTLRFQMAATAYDHPQGHQYRYWLEGYDRQFSTWTQDPIKRYTGLPDGTYQLRVQVQNTFGQRSEYEARFRFRIITPWFRHWLFHLGLWVLGAALVWGLFQWRQRRLRLENQRLEEQVQQRTQALTEANTQLQENNEELQTAYRNLKQAQTQLVQSEKMASLGQVTAGVAHEINNPINFISGGVTALRRDCADLKTVLARYQEAGARELSAETLSALQAVETERDLKTVLPEIDELLDSISMGVDRVVRIVGELRNYSRLDEDVLKPVDLHERLDSALVILQNHLRHRIEVRKEYGNLPKVPCYPGPIDQVFLNLLNNAQQAIEGNGWITLHTRVDEGYAVVELTDSGQGMPQEVLQRIFEPFFTTKRAGEGTGMGLSISEGIIRKHGGDIQVESTPGVGTRFLIRLPLAQASAEAPAPAEPGD